MTPEFPRGGQVLSNDVDIAQDIFGKICGKPRWEIREKLFHLFFRNFQPRFFGHSAKNLG